MNKQVQHEGLVLKANTRREFCAFLSRIRVNNKPNRALENFLMLGFFIPKKLSVKSTLKNWIKAYNVFIQVRI
jgi:hypothetical protein